MLLSALLCAAALTATPIPVENFAKPPAVMDMKMSPDGKYLATVVPQSDYETMLIVLDSTTLKPTGGLKSSQNKLVGDFWWVSDTRIVVAVAEKFGGLDKPQMTGHLEAVDYNGKRVTRIYGNEGEQSVGSRTQSRAADTGYAEMVHPLPDDEDNAVVAIWSGANPYTDLVRMNVVSGRKKKIASAPIPAATFLVTDDGEPAYAWGNRDGWHELYVRDAENDEWTLLNSESESGDELHPQALAADGKVYVHRLPSEGPGTIELFDPATKKGTVLYSPKYAEPAEFLLAADRRSLIGVVEADGAFSTAFFDKNQSQAKLLTALGGSFAGQRVRPLSYSRDGKTLLFTVSGDRNSGEYYLFEDGKARFLIARDEWLDPATMHAKTPIRFQARDGMALNGYLTLPTDTEKPPLVVYAHGGPHGVRDDASYDPDVQLLASRGYAVLQVNFRGSGGFGQTYEYAGYKQWGGKMIDDIADGVRWAVEQHKIDGDRVCAYGASYGGYASMMLAVREPELLRCAISYVGVSDLNLMFRRGDIQASDIGEEYLKMVLGEDKAQLREFSPTAHADKIQAAVMIAHGGDDIRVPIEHADVLRDALEEAGHTVDWLIKGNEGHGFYKEAHRVELYQRMLAFLDKHLAASR